MTRLNDVFEAKYKDNYIIPLFWQHGESHERILLEMEQMHANGIGGFIIESRPHPDFLGDSWWNDVKYMLDEAKKRNMKVWVFDDSAFPSGFAAGKIRDSQPEFLKAYLREQHIDAMGPMQGASFLVNGWLRKNESLVRIVAARRTDGVDAIATDTLVDITENVVNGILYWDIPDGYWRVFIFIRTRDGGEEGLKDYINPIEPAAVRAFIDVVYESHYAHFPDEFGETFAGFFSDESRLGNHPSYEASLGKFPMVLPYSDTLMMELDAEWKGNFQQMLPCLWYDAAEIASKVRYAYMNTVSKLYAQSFTQQIGDWCREHNVKYIGHVVEDNGAHARLGYGNGHFFRAIRGQDYSGMDIVSQVWPGYTSGKLTSFFGYLDADFFYWGLTKMAVSESHIDPKKHGRTICEIFGAYGWQEGLKLMKWLTDHVCVRGVNLLVPHAFSPKEFPDWDCPPHFYAGGHNPQWRYFHHLSEYANRICHLLSGGKHVAPVAVVYHAEAEWAGRYEPFEKVVKTLAQNQIDCDVIPIDTLVNPAETAIRDSSIAINQETYKAVIVPYSQVLPESFMQRLVEMAKGGVKIIFMQDYPTRGLHDAKLFSHALADLQSAATVTTSTHAQLPADITNAGLCDITTACMEEMLREYRYEQPDATLYFFTNESTVKSIDTTVEINLLASPLGYDAMRNVFYKLHHSVSDSKTTIRLQLEPYESMFVIFPNDGYVLPDKLAEKAFLGDMVLDFPIDGTWKISTATAEEYPTFTRCEEITGLGNISESDILPKFSGTIRYELEFEYSSEEDTARKFIDLGNAFEIAEVMLNGENINTCICPPYRFEVTGRLKAGLNKLRIDVTNTLGKQCGPTLFDCTMPQEPSGLIGPVRLMSL